MTRSVSRRSVAQGIAWSVPAVAAATAAPALAASPPAACDLSSLPGGTVDGTLTRYTYERTNVRYVGVDGYSPGTVSWWTVAIDRTQDADTLNAITNLGCDPSAITWVDNGDESFTYTVDVVRYQGGNEENFRTHTLNNADYNKYVVRTLDPRGNGGSADSRPLGPGRTTYQWVMTFPSYRDLYDLNNDHRSYTTIHSGDGLRIGGRIINQLVIDGVVQTFENQGDQLF